MSEKKNLCWSYDWARNNTINGTEHEYLCLKKSTVVNGLGLFSRQTIPKNAVIGKYNDDKLVTEAYVVDHPNSYYFYVYDFDVHGEINYDHVLCVIDGSPMTGMLRFANTLLGTRNCFNIEAIQRGMEIYFVTTRKIKPGEELFIDYGGAGEEICAITTNDITRPPHSWF